MEENKKNERNKEITGFLFAVGVTRNTDSRCPDQCLTQRRQPTTDSSESKKSEIPLIDLGQHQ